MNVFRVYGIAAIMFLAVLTGCRKTGAELEEPEPVMLAQVFHYKLFLDDIRDLIQGYETPEDSIQQVRSITEHWVRDRLVLVEAEKSLPKDVNMSKLLEDYRQSLLRHFFEQGIIEERLDTVITEADLEAYYETNKENHKLDAGIWRGYFFKIHRPATRADKILQWWRTFPSRYQDEVLKYMAKNAITQWADTSAWQEMKMVAQLFPPGTLSPESMRSNRSIVREDREYLYLLFPLAVHHAQDIAPLSRIREQVARFILHQRELALLEQIKKEIYDRDIQHEQVKILVE